MRKFNRIMVMVAIIVYIVTICFTIKDANTVVDTDLTKLYRNGIIDPNGSITFKYPNINQYEILFTFEYNNSSNSSEQITVCVPATKNEKDDTRTILVKDIANLPMVNSNITVQFVNKYLTSFFFNIDDITIPNSAYAYYTKIDEVYTDTYPFNYSSFKYEFGYTFTIENDPKYITFSFLTKPLDIPSAKVHQLTFNEYKLTEGSVTYIGVFNKTAWVIYFNSGNELVITYCLFRNNDLKIVDKVYYTKIYKLTHLPESVTYLVQRTSDKLYLSLYGIEECVEEAIPLQDNVDIQDTLFRIGKQISGNKVYLSNIINYYN